MSQIPYLGVQLKLGLDGCSWMIELNNGTKLEPTNLNDFNINLQENQKIWVVYHTRLSLKLK